jgi:hypothetical protein
VASLLNAKCSREKPLMERRYNYWYGDYNGKKTLTPLTNRCQEKMLQCGKKIIIRVFETNPRLY